MPSFLEKPPLSRQFELDYGKFELFFKIPCSVPDSDITFLERHFYFSWFYFLGKYTLAQYPGGGCLTHWRICKIFRNFPGRHPGVGFPPERQGHRLGMIWKFSKVN